MLNYIVLQGRLTKDPELRSTQSGTAVCTFTLAVDRDFQSVGNTVDFINCVAWKSTAEFISKWFTKGKQMIVNGRLESRQYDDKDGNKHTVWEVTVANAYFCERKSEPKADTSTTTFTELSGDDGDLPF